MRRAILFLWNLLNNPSSCYLSKCLYIKVKGGDLNNENMNTGNIGIADF